LQVDELQIIFCCGFRNSSISIVCSRTNRI